MQDAEPTPYSSADNESGVEAIKMTRHPFKTYIGRLRTTGFDFLDYRIGNRLINGLTIAWMTRANHRDKLNQLYEQGVSAKDIGRYVERWRRWVRSGVEVVEGWKCFFWGERAQGSLFC